MRYLFHCLYCNIDHINTNDIDRPSFMKKIVVQGNVDVICCGRCAPMFIYIIFGQAQHPGGTICYGFQVINICPNTISTQSDINYGNSRP